MKYWYGKAGSKSVVIVVEVVYVRICVVICIVRQRRRRMEDGGRCQVSQLSLSTTPHTRGIIKVLK
jgi:hypothetical protein